MLGNEPHPFTQFMIGVFLFWGGYACPFLYPGHIGLGNMYSMLGNELNLWKGCYYYGEVRLGHSFFRGPIGLGNWPHMLGNGPICNPGGFVPWDVLYLGRFVLGMFCPLGRVFPWDVLSLETLCPLGRFVSGTFCLATFCLGMFCLGTFLCASCF